MKNRVYPVKTLYSRPTRNVSNNRYGYWPKLATLWSELSEHPESDVRGACRHFLDGMCALLDADYGFTVIAGR
jgi:hypothetical protein